jgi:hypothetical protein
MPIHWDQIKPNEKGKYSNVFLAWAIQHVADKEIGKITGVEDIMKKPFVYVHISDEVLSPPRLTGEEGFEGASPLARDVIRMLIPTMERFVVAPHMIDHFRPHTRRRAWAKKNITDNADIPNVSLRQQMYTHFKDNKLSMNYYQRIESGINVVLSRAADLHCPEIEYLRRITTMRGEEGCLPDMSSYLGVGPDGIPNTNKYDEMEPQEKWEISKKYVDAVLGLLELLSTQAGLERKRISLKPPPFAEIEAFIGTPQPLEEISNAGEGKAAMPKLFADLLAKLAAVELNGTNGTTKKTKE